MSVKAFWLVKVCACVLEDEAGSCLSGRAVLCPVLCFEQARGLDVALGRLSFDVHSCSCFAEGLV